MVSEDGIPDHNHAQSNREDAHRGVIVKFGALVPLIMRLCSYLSYQSNER
jgi:hypothetical protein